ARTLPTGPMPAHLTSPNTTSGVAPTSPRRQPLLDARSSTASRTDRFEDAGPTGTDVAPRVGGLLWMVHRRGRLQRAMRLELRTGTETMHERQAGLDETFPAPAVVSVAEDRVFWFTT